ncbi:sigma-54-dependent Fis family transcriptional regulator [bacterium]|nr:sigma-54-dependent Fis family transcriptional regulator [bacterium]
MAKALIVDDDRMVCQTISNVVESLNHQAESVRSLEECLQTVQSNEYDVIFLDVRMPDGSGIDFLPRICKDPSSPEVIIITGYGDPDGAELAIKNGAWDYVEKPLSLRSIKLPFLRALQYREEKKSAPQPVSLRKEGIVGESPKMETCFDMVAKAASNDANVLITGETGTGKELFAWAVHNNSSRAHKNFVVVDCTALPETLVESVLFGHSRGAFTGANKSREGLIKQSDGGTLFLDEVAELPLSMQKKFLRVLQERKFRPVGSNQEMKSDFRLVAATNQDIESLMKQGKFREDLLFRLRSLVIDLPPLRENKEDIKKIAVHYLNKLSDRFGMENKGVSPEFWRMLHQYDWPGNVRELIQALEHALASAQSEPTLHPQHLPEHIRIQVVRESVQKNKKDKKPYKKKEIQREELPQLKEVREKAVSETEKEYLKDLITLTGGNIQEAIRISGLSRSRLYTLLKKYNLSPSEGRK